MKFQLLPFATLACLGLAACAHYRLGTGGELTFRTLYVAPVENSSDAPQASALMSMRLRDELLRDGRVELVNTPEEADATLTFVLNGYGREVATVRPGDTGRARKFALTLEGRATLVDNRSAKTLFADRTLSAARDAFTDSGQLQAEYQTLSLLTGDLAKKVAHAMLDVW